MILTKFFKPVFVIALWFGALSLSAQAPQNWFHLDPTLDHFNGVSTDRAYEELLSGKISQTVIVAVIDGGTDASHPDLKDKIWVNEDEIPDNGIDDDKNGYIDDINGWNFIGGKNGNVQYDNLEITRLYKPLKAKYENMDAANVPASQQQEYEYYLSLKSDYDEESESSKLSYDFYNGIMHTLQLGLDEMGKENPTAAQVEAWQPKTDSTETSKTLMITVLNQGATIPDVMKELEGAKEQFTSSVEYHYNLDYDPRAIVGDNYTDASERIYGNNDVKGPEATHGTHVAGIIGAERNNGLGMNGIVDNVRIMVIRCVPDGDERDKDVANAIRYAADNGAKVINMSFGKGYPFNKKAVDDAVKYAMSKDVLLVHGSGNDSKDVDVNSNYPNDQFEDGGSGNDYWINVGASGWDKSVADFSNYGLTAVDIWAPGVEIYSTIPNSKYENLQGTSMASPVVAGVAALIRSYFPQLTAPEVKQILLESAYVMKGKVAIPGGKKKVKLKAISVSGGIVNAYKAVLLAQERTMQ